MAPYYHGFDPTYDLRLSNWPINTCWAKLRVLSHYALAWRGRHLPEFNWALIMLLLVFNFHVEHWLPAPKGASFHPSAPNLSSGKVARARRSSGRAGRRATARVLPSRPPTARRSLAPIDSPRGLTAARHPLCPEPRDLHCSLCLCHNKTQLTRTLQCDCPTSPAR